MESAKFRASSHRRPTIRAAGVTRVAAALYATQPFSCADGRRATTRNERHLFATTVALQDFYEFATQYSSTCEEIAGAEIPRESRGPRYG